MSDDVPRLPDPGGGCPAMVPVPPAPTHHRRPVVTHRPPRTKLLLPLVLAGAGIAVVAASVRLRPDDGWINGTVGGAALVVLAAGSSAAILLNLVVMDHDEVRVREFTWCWLRHTVVRRGEGVEMRHRSQRVSGTMVRLRRVELRWPGRRRKRTIGLNTYSALAQRQIVARLQELATRP